MTAGLRALASFLDANPDVPIPLDLRDGLTIWTPNTRKEFTALAHDLGATDLAQRGTQVFAGRMFAGLRVDVGIPRRDFDGHGPALDLPTLDDLYAETVDPVPYRLTPEGRDEIDRARRDLEDAQIRGVV